MRADNHHQLIMDIDEQHQPPPYYYPSNPYRIQGGWFFDFQYGYGYEHPQHDDDEDMQSIRHSTWR